VKPRKTITASRCSPTGSISLPRFFSVADYDDRVRFARRLSNPRAITFHGVRWAVGAPPVQNLTTEWQETDEARLRIIDRQLYNRQMHQLLGLDKLGVELRVDPEE